MPLSLLSLFADFCFFLCFLLTHFKAPNQDIRLMSSTGRTSASSELPVPLSTFSHFPCSQVLPFSFCSSPFSTSLPLCLTALFLQIALFLQSNIVSYEHPFPVTPVSVRQQFETCVISKSNSYFTYDTPDSLIVLFLCRFLTQSGNSQCCSALSLVRFLAAVWGKLSIKNNFSGNVRFLYQIYVNYTFLFNHIISNRFHSDRKSTKCNSLPIFEFKAWIKLVSFIGIIFFQRTKPPWLAKYK